MAREIPMIQDPFLTSMGSQIGDVGTITNRTIYMRWSYQPLRNRACLAEMEPVISNAACRRMNPGKRLLP